MIEFAGLQNTDKLDKYKASQKLLKTLDKLQNIKCINYFSPKNITTRDEQEIIFYSPLQKQINLQ